MFFIHNNDRTVLFFIELTLSSYREMVYRTYLTMSNRIHKEDRASQQEILKEASLPVNKKEKQ